MVAKSYQSLKQIGEPYYKNGKQYVVVLNENTGNKREVRWYTESEYVKLYGSLPTALRLPSFTSLPLPTPGFHFHFHEHPTLQIPLCTQAYRFLTLPSSPLLHHRSLVYQSPASLLPNTTFPSVKKTPNSMQSLPQILS